MKSSSHSGIPLLLCPSTCSMQFSATSSLLREFAGSNEIDRSCGCDVEEELVLVLDDSPGTTKGTKFWCFGESLHPVFGQTWLATAGPLTSVAVLFAKLAKGQYGRSVVEQLHSGENTRVTHINLRFSIRLDLSIGCYHCYGRSGSLESFQLSSARVLLT